MGRVKAIITIGLPASGKSTWAKKWCKSNADWVRVNRDDLRRMRGVYWVPQGESLITEWVESIIKSSHSNNKNIVVDNTHLNDKHVEEVIKFLKEVGYTEIEKKVFDVGVDECIKRDSLRSVEEQVGEKAIRGMYTKYILPLEYKDQKANQDASLPHALICDLDGTLALLNGRDPYRAETCYDDEVNLPVKDVLLAWVDSRIQEPLHHHHIFFFSGRMQRQGVREATERWLRDKVGVDSSASNVSLIMRENDDFRKDNVVKKEMYMTHIRDKYYIDFVLDDRQSVVDMWRELGLTCFQVAKGNF